MARRVREESRLPVADGPGLRMCITRATGCPKILRRHKKGSTSNAVRPGTLPRIRAPINRGRIL